MNWWILISGLLALVTTAIHVFAGGPDVHVPVQSSDSLAPDVRATMAVVWHGITAVLLLSGATKVYAAFSERMKPTVAFIVALDLAFAALFVGYGLVRFGSLSVMPQWTLFIVLAGLAAVGLRSPAALQGKL